MSFKVRGLIACPGHVPLLSPSLLPSRPQLVGQATANGCALTSAATLRDLRPLLGFVAKEDVVDRRLTPRELFTLSARQVGQSRHTYAWQCRRCSHAALLRSTCLQARPAPLWTQPWHARFAPST